jgi:hypothetical protein
MAPGPQNSSFTCTAIMRGLLSPPILRRTNGRRTKANPDGLTELTRQVSHHCRKQDVYTNYQDYCCNGDATTTTLWLLPLLLLAKCVQQGDRRPRRKSYASGVKRSRWTPPEVQRVEGWNRQHHPHRHHQCLTRDVGQPSFRIAACCGFVGSRRIRERTAVLHADLRVVHLSGADLSAGQLRVGNQTKSFRRIEEAAAPEGFVG